MSRREIADLTAKEHKHVLTDIRKMLMGLNLRSVDFSADVPDGYVRMQPSIQLMAVGTQAANARAYETFATI